MHYLRNLAVLIVFLLALPQGVFAQTFAEPAFEETVFKARIVSVGVAGERGVEGTSLTETYQSVTAELLEGPRRGEVLTLENTSQISYEAGDVVYLHRLPPLGDEAETWSVGEPDRVPVLLGLLGVFVLVTILVAGVQGLRSLIALAASFALIIFALVPALSLGFPPVLTSVGLGVAILALSMFITHGVNKPTVVALLGSVMALVVAAALAQLAVLLAKLTGFVSDEAVFLNFATSGAVDLTGLLLGGILVGIIGVLNDVSVSQVHTVVELHDANPELGQAGVWSRAMKVGREHMGAVVNTLPLAYAGVSLPLLLLFSQSDAPFSFIVNREIFAAEVVRALAGSIGLLLSGAIATLLAVWLLVPQKPRGIMPVQTNN